METFKEKLCVSLLHLCMVVPRNFPLFLLADILVLDFPLRRFPLAHTVPLDSSASKGN